MLTDGKSEIIAIEIETLRDIDVYKTLPGTKVRLFGPIEIRRGIWTLRRSNVEIIWHNLLNKELLGPQSFVKANELILGQKEELEILEVNLK